MNPLDAIGDLMRQAMAEVRQEMLARLDGIEQRLAAVEARAGGEQRRCMSVSETCKAYGFSESAWDKWLADPSTGLERVVVRRGRRVFVPVDGAGGFDEWFRGLSVARRRVG